MPSKRAKFSSVSQIHVCTSGRKKYFVIRTEGRKPRIGTSFTSAHLEGKQGGPLEGGATIWIETDEPVKVTR